MIESTHEGVLAAKTTYLTRVRRENLWLEWHWISCFGAGAGRERGFAIDHRRCDGPTASCREALG